MLIAATYWDAIICHNAGISSQDYFKIQVSDDTYRSQLRFNITSYLDALQGSENTVFDTAVTERFIKKRIKHVIGTQSLPALPGWR